MECLAWYKEKSLEIAYHAASLPLAEKLKNRSCMAPFIHHFLFWSWLASPLSLPSLQRLTNLWAYPEQPLRLFCCIFQGAAPVLPSQKSHQSIISASMLQSRGLKQNSNIQCFSMKKVLCNLTLLCLSFPEQNFCPWFYVSASDTGLLDDSRTCITFCDFFNPK